MAVRGRRGRGAQQGEPTEWRPARGSAFTQAGLREAFVAAFEQTLQQWVLRIFGLDQHFAAAVLAPGSSGDLHDGLSEALGGAKVGAE